MTLTHRTPIQSADSRPPAPAAGPNRTWTRPVVLMLALLTLAACGDQGPESGPGTVTAELVGPEASQGAAEIRLVGSGVQAVTAIDGRAFSRRRGDTTVVVIARETAGPLRFSVQLLDTTKAPVATVVEVAGPDNVLRTNPAGYSVRMGGGQ